MVYYFFLLLELLAAIFILVYTLSMLFSFLKGSPYVSTKRKNIDTILEEVHLKPGQLFLELGCGDGRVTRLAVQKYAVKGIGVDIIPTVLLLARIRSYLQGLKNIHFLEQDVKETDLSKADVLYIFLFPKLILQMKDKIMNEVKKDALIISHGFKIPFLENKLIKQFKVATFNTYFYKM